MWISTNLTASDLGQSGCRSATCAKLIRAARATSTNQNCSHSDCAVIVKGGISMLVHEEVSGKDGDLAIPSAPMREWKSHRVTSRLEFCAPTSLAGIISGWLVKVQGSRDFTATLPSPGHVLNQHVIIQTTPVHRFIASYPGPSHTILMNGAPVRLGDCTS